MITASGVGSGIDIESIITQLMAIERQPIEQLSSRQAALDVELSAFGRIKSAMSELASTVETMGDRSRFGPFVSTSANEDVLVASASGAAASEAHEVEVLALAVAQRLATRAYPSPDAPVGSGSYSFSSGELDFSVKLAKGSDSLLDLRDAINGAADNTMIQASVLQVDDGARLVLTARESGLDNAISAKRGGFVEITPASDARLVVDGFDVTRASNSIADVIGGVTLELVDIGSSRIDTRRDPVSMRETLDGFVAAYNALNTELESAASNALQGDRLPRNASIALRNAFSAALAEQEQAAGDEQTRSSDALSLGFSFDRTGVLSIDEARLGAVQEQSLERFVNTFARADTGFAQLVEATLQTFTGADGSIQAREEGVESRKASMERQIEQRESRLEQIETRYRRQFGAMDSLVSQLQSTSAFLTQRLSG